MSVKGTILQILFAFALCSTVQGRPVYDDYSDNEVEQYFGTEPAVISTTTRATTTSTPTPTTAETTTEYKYKEIAEAYTVEVPHLHSIRHAAGTLYFELQPGEDLQKKLLQVQRDSFDVPFSRTHPPKQNNRRVAPSKD
ncbi:uncharacterized protein LOC128737703 [Sabethes cyaneus]|uniref:uncharacterized protein LOC128737703 n=1 Tax=Sabethes cyaneus TaxID=53552 RepID=UPI00237D63B2|nr:uncharacterized protein LOC128737703 [Sabethes cyaneus]